MKIVKTIESVRTVVEAARRSGKTIGFVPTMGALHIGHISLIQAAAKECDFVVVSIFVNPTQFGAGEDLEKYPRTLQQDLKLCDKAGVDVVFTPENETMYPGQNLTWVNVEKLTDGLCGQFRPGHFRAVATICNKLFNIVQPDVAYFGQKDAQQAAVIKQIVADLNMPLQVVVCPTVREENGLAVSSRNRYLTDQQKKDAASIYQALVKAQQLVDAGVLESAHIIAAMRTILQQGSSIQVEYISVVDAQTLQPIDTIVSQALIAIAVRIGPARLIDNIIVQPAKNSV
ncbi:MAG TPA: pantoate--beta-alanine ligase [Sedimentisphaerales bacterium]|nr:pantoate--beta-alanine ligase [Sedimentisphaerales bacterium]